MMKKIEFEELTKLIDPIVGARDNWFLVSAGKDKNVNCLTAGWFGLGNVWEKKVATIYIRPQRHTKKFIDETGRFTLTFFENQKNALVYLGSHSGKDVPNKIEVFWGLPSRRSSSRVLSSPRRELLQV